MVYVVLDQVSETSCFFGIQDDGKSPEKFCEFCTMTMLLHAQNCCSVDTPQERKLVIVKVTLWSDNVKTSEVQGRIIVQCGCNCMS
jgi:hypothetical protein